MSELNKLVLEVIEEYVDEKNKICINGEKDKIIKAPDILARAEIALWTIRDLSREIY